MKSIGSTGLAYLWGKIKSYTANLLNAKQDILTAGTDIEIARCSSALPPEYQQVEYLQSSGTQIIDLGIKWSYNISAITICEMLSSSGTALGPVGARNSSSYVWGNFCAGTTNYACFGDKVNRTFSQDMVDGAFHSWKTDNLGFYLDDVIKADLSGSNDALVSNDNICLFGRYDGNGNVERTGNWRIKSHQTYNNGALVQNLIPARRRADDALGMYDTITDTFFLNVGTGTFHAGENVGDVLTIRFTNDSGFITGYTETDPTVPAWAKQSTKPSYTASEVGALPDDTQLFSGDYNDLDNKPTIPTAVTESTVSGWGFTKNTGTYTKPASGIPATDIASGVIPTVPTTLSSFTDDLGSSPTHTHSQYLTSAPVTSVNGQTGAVTIATGENNVIESVTFNGTTATVTNKTAAIMATIPTITFRQW